jgi:hypothetical protein
MMYENLDEKATLWNHLMRGRIDRAAYEMILSTGKVARGKERSQLIAIRDLIAWKVIEGDQ